MTLHSLRVSERRPRTRRPYEYSMRRNDYSTNAAVWSDEYRCVARASGTGGSRADGNATHPARHRRRTASAEDKLRIGASDRPQRSRLCDRLRGWRRASACVGRRRAADAAAHFHHAPSFRSRRGLRQSDMARVDRRPPHTRRHVGSSSAGKNDGPVSSDERVRHQVADGGRRTCAASTVDTPARSSGRGTGRAGR
jgi:hypothetical protein